MSLSGPEAAEKNKEQVQNQGGYNLKLGPVLFDMSAGVDTEYSDNINLAETNRQSDFIIRPHVDLTGRWQVSDLNTLTLTTGLAYEKYLSHPEDDTSSILMAPNSELAFNLYVGDFKINFHDRFDLSQDSVSEGTLSGVAKFERIYNTVGVWVDWDLNDVILSAGYDDGTTQAFQKSFNYVNQDQQQLTGRASFKLTDAITTGLQGTYTLTNYETDYQNNSNAYAVGPFIDMIITPHMTGFANVGYGQTFFDRGGLNGDTENAGSVYGMIGLSHSMNQYFSHTISAGYDTELGLTSNFEKTAYVRYAQTWNVIKDVSVSTEAFYENVTESQSVTQENFDRFGAGINLGYRLTQKLTATVGYQYLQKDSDLAGRNYDQDRVTLDLNYKF